MRQLASADEIVGLAQAVLCLPEPGGPHGLLDAVAGLLPLRESDPLVRTLFDEGQVRLGEEFVQEVELAAEVDAPTEVLRVPSVHVPGGERRGRRLWRVPKARYPEAAVARLEPELPGLRRWADQELPAIWLGVHAPRGLAWIRDAVAAAPARLFTPTAENKPDAQLQALLALLSAAELSPELLMAGAEAVPVELPSYAEYVQQGPVQLRELGLRAGGELWRAPVRVRNLPPLAPLRALGQRLARVRELCAPESGTSPSAHELFLVALGRLSEHAPWDEAEGLWRRAPEAVCSALSALCRALHARGAERDGAITPLEQALRNLFLWWSAQPGLALWHEQFHHPTSFAVEVLREEASAGRYRVVSRFAPEGAGDGPQFAVDVRESEGQLIFVTLENQAPRALAMLEKISNSQLLLAALEAETRGQVAEATRHRWTHTEHGALLDRSLSELGNRIGDLLHLNRIEEAQHLATLLRELGLARPATEVDRERSKGEIPVPLRFLGGVAHALCADRDPRLLSPQVQLDGCTELRVPPTPLFGNGKSARAMREWVALWVENARAFDTAVERLSIAHNPRQIVDAGAELLARCWLFRLLLYASLGDRTRVMTEPEGRQIVDLERKLLDLLWWNGARLERSADTLRASWREREPALLLPVVPAWLRLAWAGATGIQSERQDPWGPIPPAVVWEGGIAPEPGGGGSRIIGSWALELRMEGDLKELLAELFRAPAPADPKRAPGAALQDLEPYLASLQLRFDPPCSAFAPLPPRTDGAPFGVAWEHWEIHADPEAPLGVAWTPGVRSTRAGETSWMLRPTVVLKGARPSFVQNRFQPIGSASATLEGVPLVAFGVPAADGVLRKLLPEAASSGDELRARLIASAVLIAAWWPPEIAHFLAKTRTTMSQVSRSIVPNRYLLDAPSFRLLREALLPWMEALKTTLVEVDLQESQINIRICVYGLQGGDVPVSAPGLVQVAPRP